MIENYISNLPNLIKEKFDFKNSKDDSLLTFIDSDSPEIFPIHISDKKVLKSRRKNNEKIFLAKMSPNQTRPIISLLKDKKKATHPHLNCTKSKPSERSILNGLLKGTNTNFFKTQLDRQVKANTNGSHSGSIDHKRKTVLMNFDKKASSPNIDSNRGWCPSHTKVLECRELARKTIKNASIKVKESKQTPNVSRQKIEFNIPKLMIHMKCYQSPGKKEKPQLKIYTNLNPNKGSFNFSSSPRKPTLTNFPTTAHSILKTISTNDHVYPGSPYSKNIFDSRPTKGKYF